MKAQDLLDSIAACLCAAIKDAPVPDVCFCGVVPGDGVVTEYAGNCDGENQGMAWVRQTLIYPAAGLNVVNENPLNCGSAMGMDIEIGMIRPAAAPDAFGNPPSAEDYRRLSSLTNDDALIMWRALACCTSLTELDYILGTYQPFGPMGGVVGGVWSAAVILD
jgi:hypothetical protein